MSGMAADMSAILFFFEIYVGHPDITRNCLIRTHHSAAATDAARQLDRNPITDRVTQPLQPNLQR